MSISTLPVLCKTRAFKSTVSKSLCFLSRLSVFYSNSGFPTSILNLWWNINWLHIRCDECARRNCPESLHCPSMRSQWDCFLDDFQEFRSTEFLKKNQYHTEFFLVSPSSLVLVHFSSDRCWECTTGSEDNLLFSRIQPLHHLLEVDYHDEEDWSDSSTLNNRWANFSDTEWSVGEWFHQFKFFRKSSSCGSSGRIAS